MELPLHSFARIYQAVGLIVLLIPLIVMTVSQVHYYDEYGFDSRVLYVLGFVFIILIFLRMLE